ncbi:hypothetical protein CCAN11_500002 [Capnocytophaga canimorsus]|uniref:Uncharacterized protein n=1 Tax=Capnocytophaga canimorsus TaxID=28188 RepID=A0A0B7IMI5_9FLAO|nr:hypothetical protein CCAN11_500002 [Capnocytophaga canimorsus]
MSIFLEANNLTNQPLRYYQGISARTMQVEYYRPKYNMGIKLDFLIFCYKKSIFYRKYCQYKFLKKSYLKLFYFSKRRK